MKFFIKLGAAGDTPETPDTPPTENAPLHRGAATEIEETHQYIYAGRKLLRETITEGSTTKTLDFTYDNVGMPYSLIYNNGTTTTTYYYITNLQGDVMYLVDSSGNEVAAYDYDPYGKIISATGDLAGINPLRYRGYYYDTETGFYYLQSRYYDPEICRFINADSYTSTGVGYLGYNMFAYCNNNPTNSFDPSGKGKISSAIISALISGVASGVATLALGGTWAEAGENAIKGALSSFAVVGGILIFGDVIDLITEFKSYDMEWWKTLIGVGLTIALGVIKIKVNDELTKHFCEGTFGTGGELIKGAIRKVLIGNKEKPHREPVAPTRSSTLSAVPGGGTGSSGAFRTAHRFVYYIN